MSSSLWDTLYLCIKILINNRHTNWSKWLKSYFLSDLWVYLDLLLDPIYFEILTNKICKNRIFWSSLFSLDQPATKNQIQTTIFCFFLLMQLKKRKAWPLLFSNCYNNNNKIKKLCLLYFEFGFSSICSRYNKRIVLWRKLRCLRIII